MKCQPMRKKLAKCKIHLYQVGPQSFRLCLRQLPQRQQPKQWLMPSLQAALEETTFPLSWDSLIAGAGGVGHVGQCIISRGTARRAPEDQVPVIRISSIQSNVLLLDCKIKGVPVTAVVDCGSAICILSDKVFKSITFNRALRKVGSKVVGAEGSQLNILGTVELHMAFKGIRAKQLFYICDNLKQSALLGVYFLRENGCVVDFNKGTLYAGNTEVYLRDESSWQVYRVFLVETVTI